MVEKITEEQKEFLDAEGRVVIIGLLKKYYGKEILQ